MSELKFNLREADLIDLALQRTGPLLAMGGGAAFALWQHSGDTSALAHFFRSTNSAGRFLQAVVAEIESDSKSILGTAPPKIVKMASIGPGLCILELLLYRQWKCSFYLIDIEESKEHQHGFAMSGSGYSDLGSALRFLTDNGVPKIALNTCNPRKQKLDHSSVDLIMSILSMGFHYPLDEYVSYIRSALPPGGLLIFDKRKDTEDQGWKDLAPEFSIEANIDCGKFQRLACRKNPT